MNFKQDLRVTILSFRMPVFLFLRHPFTQIHTWRTQTDQKVVTALSSKHFSSPRMCLLASHFSENANFKPLKKLEKNIHFHDCTSWSAEIIFCLPFEGFQPGNGVKRWTLMETRLPSHYFMAVPKCLSNKHFSCCVWEIRHRTPASSGKRLRQLQLFIAFLFWARSDELAVPRGAVQSEIGLMLPTTTPGPFSRDQEQPHKRDWWLFLQGQSKWFFLRQINGVSLPKMFSHLARRCGEEIWNCSLHSWSIICHS